MNEEKEKKRQRYLPINAMIIPIIVVLAILHITVIFLILGINRASFSLSRMMQLSAERNQEATSLLAGSSLLSETSSGFVVNPVDEEGNVNTGALVAFASEVRIKEHRGDAILADFEGFDIDKEAYESLSDAADAANALINNELTAFALIDSVYTIPQNEKLEGIELPELSDEDKALPDEAKLAKARGILMGAESGAYRQRVSSGVNKCVGMMSAANAAKSEMTGKSISLLRTALWIVTISIIVILAVTFVQLYRYIVYPLNDFVELISEDKQLNGGKGVKEIVLLADAYNGLLARREALERILRLAAETDTLTGLHNRYAFEQYVIESRSKGRSMAVILFDVNNLKQVNDGEGHHAGDELLKRTAECISKCFGNGDNNNCFRFGGDEFAAIIRSTNVEEIEWKLGRFEELQQDMDISVSAGYAFTSDMGETNFKELMKKADSDMYEKKQKMHREGR